MSFCQHPWRTSLPIIVTIREKVINKMQQALIVGRRGA
jgi:hypothetical protein